MARGITIPKRNTNSLGKAVGVAQIVGGAFSGNPAMIAGGVAGASGGQNDGINKISAGLNLANTVSGIKNKAMESASQKPELKNISAQDGITKLQAGESALNELRQTDPELAKELGAPLYQGMFEFSSRLKNDQPLWGPLNRPETSSQGGF